MEKESPKQHLWCPCSIHYNAKSDRILHGKYFLLQQNYIFRIEKSPSSSFANCLYVQYTSTEQAFSKPMKVKIHKANICTNILKIISHCEPTG
jgi:hypothetical protein